MRIHLGHTFHGAGNVGDDLLIAGFLHVWHGWGAGEQLTCATPFDNRSQQLRFPEIAWLPGDEESRTEAIRQCDIWLAPGGPSFQSSDGPWLLDQLAFDAEMCRKFRKPMFYLCVGASNRAAGEDPRTRLALDTAEHVWTRDGVTVDVLRANWKHKVTEGADLAHLYLQNREPRPLAPNTLGWVLHFDNRSLLHLPAVADAIRAFRSREQSWLVQEVRNWPGTEEDSLAALPADVRELLAVYRPDYANAPRVLDLLNAWPACETVATSRLHAALISAWAGSRIALIERDDKLASAADILGCVRLPHARDSHAIRDAVERAQPVPREVLKEQAAIAWQCGAEFFRTIRTATTIPATTPEVKVMPETSEFSLTSAEIEQFHRDGFLGPYTAFTPEEMAPLRDVLVNSVMETPSAFSGYRTQSRHLDSKSMWAMCSATAIVERLKSLYGPDLILWYSNIFDKSPARAEHQGEYPWHQDMWHWKIEPKISLCVWLAVTPATVENGCVELIPGSHTREIPTVRQSDGSFADWFGDLKADPAYFDESKKVQMVLKPGQFFIFNEATLHHSNPNRTNARRIGMSFRVTVPRVKSDRTHPCVLLSGRDTAGVNPLIAPPTTDPNPRAPVSSLIDGTDYTFDKPLHGLGWHLIERDAGTWMRWTGPETTSWMELRAPGDEDCELCVQMRHAITHDVLQSLEVRVNDYVVPLGWRANGVFVEVFGRVPAAALSNAERRARVELRVAEVKRFRDTQPGNTDTRQLGVAVTRIMFTPVPAELPVEAPAIVEPQAEPQAAEPAPRKTHRPRASIFARVLRTLTQRVRGG